MRPVKDAARLVGRAFLRWKRDHIERFAAALAYYSMFSLAPLLMLGVAVAQYVASRRQTAEFVGGLAHATMGEIGPRLVEPILRTAPRPGTDITATILALLTLLYGASGLFTHLQEALDSIFGAPPRTVSWLRAYVKRRLSAALVCAAFVLLLVVGPTAATAAAALGRSQWSNVAISVLLETFGFALIFRYVPNIRLPWATVLPGAVMTASLFTAGQSLLALYLGAIAARTVYGAASSLAALLVWVYASAQLLLFGAEIIQAWRDMGAASESSAPSEPPLREPG